MHSPGTEQGIAWVRRAQAGGVTVITAVLVLIMMLLLLVYAARVSVFETRVSSNDVLQKEAFHAAEAAIDQAIMYLLPNTPVIISSRMNVFPDGTAFTRNGWFGAGAGKWLPCPENPGNANPCGGEIEAVAGSFYYDTDQDATTVESLPIVTTDFPANTTARVTAILCFVDMSRPTDPCSAAPVTEREESTANMVLTLLSYGYSDCTDVSDISTCNGEATMAQPLANFRILAGAPTVPLTAKSAFPPTGTTEIVANPNAGGVGVPLTTWVNDNPTCHPGTSIIGSGSWQTCELQEWYQTTELPPGINCISNNCLCGPGGNNLDYFLSWNKAGETNISLDIIVDSNFPCDLFEYYFGVPRSKYHVIKNQAKVLSDCSSLGPHSRGLIWISGSDCTPRTNTSIGSPNFPVILVSAATDTSLSGGTLIYGVLYVFDGEDNSADLSSNGNAIIYGSVIADAAIEGLQGTFQVVYSEAALGRAAGIAGLGRINGGWRDFGLPGIAW